MVILVFASQPARGESYQAGVAHRSHRTPPTPSRNKDSRFSGAQTLFSVEKALGLPLGLSHCHPKGVWLDHRVFLKDLEGAEIRAASFLFISV